MVVSGGTVNVSNSYFDGNYAHSAGGAIRNESAIVNIANSIFDGNTTDRGGAAISSCGEPNNSTAGVTTITGSKFLNNTLTGSGDGGGAIGPLLPFDFRARPF